MEDPRHWPYANEYVRSSFDPKLIEQHAGEIVSRSLTYRRMIAFVGSGVTLAYGRLNWDELVTFAVKQVHELIVKTRPSPLSDSDASLVRLIASEAKPHGSRPRKVEDKTSLLLLCKQVYERFPVAKDTPFGTLIAGAVRNICQHAVNIAIDRPDPSVRHALQRHLQANGLALANLDEARHHYIHVLATDINPADASSHLKHPLRVHSAPIYTLISRLGINRLLTTNYDPEIEKTLDALLSPGDPPGGYDQQAFDPAESAKALRFAVDGRRPHTTVLHLHGFHEQPKNMVVTETDYQRLYLRDSDRRDLVDNSMHALFAANPLLFIGTDLTEDDILRPLRLFMSNYDPHSDRVAVALLPARKPRNDLMLDKIKLLTRYGVHAIHYDLHGRLADGRAPIHVDPDSGAEHTWLSAFGELRLLVKDGKLADATALWATLRSHAMAPAPAGSASADDGLGLKPDLAMVDHVFELLRSDPAQATPPYVARILKEALNSIVTFALCEALLSLAHQRQGWHRLRSSSAPSYQPRRRAYLRQTPPYHRLTLALQHRALADAALHRFAADSTGEDQRVDQLLFDLASNPPFCRWPGRRTLLIATKRGAGKGSLFDAFASSPSGPGALQRLRGTLNMSESETTTGLLVLNSTTDLLNLSDIIGRLIGAHAFERNEATPDSARLRPHSNIFGRLEFALDRLADSRPSGNYRVLILMSQIGMLFNEEGQPKNGLVARFINLLSHPKYQTTPLDMVLFTDENQLPAQFREYLNEGDPSRQLVDPLGPRTDVRLDYQEWREHEAAVRLDRLQIGALRQNERVHLHVPRREWASKLARRHFAALWAALPGHGAENGSDEAWFKAINRLTGGSRIGLTMLFALAEEACLLAPCNADRAQGCEARLAAFQAEALSALTAHPLESAPDSTLNHIFDHWSTLHVETLAAVDGTLDRRVRAIAAAFLPAATAEHVMQRAALFWRFCQELLWHLAVVSHPVDKVFLSRCPGVRDQAMQCLLPNDANDAQLVALIEAALEVCVFRCLVFRQTPVKDSPDYRYSVHRLVQRYFFRRMGGKNVEPTDWDQFSTTLYSSQPDDSPTFTGAAHRKLTELIRSLARYPAAASPGRTTVPEGTPASLRQAYFVLRGTYSVGALSRISRIGEGSHDAPDPGYFEDYRRLVRWITLQAAKESRAIFHPGELVWLYKECGVVNLAQGKLEDADTALSLAEAAAGTVEADATGSLHVRVRLNAALVMIERGRPLRARAMLLPIAKRVGGNTASAQIAQHYLGLLEHLAGNYAEADQHYQKAAQGLRHDKRWRALALVTKDRADLHLVRHPSETDAALTMVNEAMDLAQRGGHEDVRILCALTRANIHVQSHSTAHHAKVYGALLDAERYARELDMPRVLCEAREIRACMLLLQGETRLSALEASRSLEIAALYDMKLRKARGLLTLARIYHARTDDAGALALVETGSEIAASAEYYACVKGFRDLQMQIDPSGRRTSSADRAREPH